MLIFLSPRITTCQFAVECELVDIVSKTLGVHLRNNVEVTARKPFPNKTYLAACRKVGKTAINGLLFETKSHVPEFDLTTRWCVDGDILVEHKVNYHVLDAEFDAVTDNMLLWYSQGEGSWARRWPAHITGNPLHAQPRFTLAPRGEEAPGKERVEHGIVVAFEQAFDMHTVEPERVLNSQIDKRMPAFADAFKLSI